MTPAGYKRLGYAIALTGLGLTALATVRDIARPPAPPLPVTALAETRRQITTASVAHLFVSTALSVAYASPVAADRSATVRATVTQDNILTELTPGRESQRQPYARLQWPLELTLSSAAFEFAPGENARKLAAGAALPAEVVWAPVARKPGAWDMTLRVENFSGGVQPITRYISPPDTMPVLLTVNGRTTQLALGQDLVLPVAVEPERFLGLVPDPLGKLAMAIVFPFIGFACGSEYFRRQIWRLWRAVAG